MKNLLLLFIFILALAVNAQAQTFSIGATSPNTKAALHIESPTNNQGVLMPRLTTAQRTAMSLTAADIGLQLYDTDLKGIYAWDGTGWRNGGLVLPLLASVSTAASAVDIANIGTGNAGAFKIQNTASLGNAVFATTNSSNDRPTIYSEHVGIGSGAGAFKILNATNGFAGVYGETNGTGSAGYFKSLNAANTNAALYAESNGSGAAIYGWQTGTGWAGYFNIANNASTASTIRVGTNGLGDAATFFSANAANTNPTIRATASAINSAGLFSIGNAANTAPALVANTVGISAGSFIRNNTGGAGTALFASTNSNLGGTAIEGSSTGTAGHGGNFIITNAANNYPALNASTTGTGAAIQAQTSTGFAAVQGVRDGATNGNAGKFETTNASNTYAALQSKSVGVGAALFAENTGTGGAGYFSTNNASNSISSLFATTNGTGNAGNFSTTNAANANPALMATSNGNANAIVGLHTGTGSSAGYFNINNAANSFNALQVNTVGTGGAGGFSITNASNSYSALISTTNGTGSAGNFNINNASSSAAALTVSTNSPTGNAITATGNVQATKFVGDGSLLTNLPPVTFPFAATVSSGSSLLSLTNSGTSNAAWFQSNSGTLATVETYSSNAGALFAQNTGTGTAGFFNKNSAASTTEVVTILSSAAGPGLKVNLTNAVNTLPAIQARTNGTGNAADFEIVNTANNAAALVGRTNSNTPFGTGVNGYATGTGGQGGSFEINNAANIYAAVVAKTNGTGSVLWLNHVGSSGNIATLQSANINVARIDKTGKGFFNGGTQASGADVAEMFDVEGTKSEYEPGDVLVISELTDRTVEKSSEANSTKVVGVYATKPGVILTEKGIEENLDQLVPMGVIGVIPTKVCLENGPIKRGDLLVTSSKKGHAMKAIPVVFTGVSIYPTGAVLGKALENFEGTESGVIKVLVNVK